MLVIVKKLTPNCLKVLRQIAEGLGTHHGVFGMSEHGGRTTTLYALTQRGLIDRDYKITEVGRMLLAEYATKEANERVANTGIKPQPKK